MAAHGRGSATDICYRMTSFSPSTHLSFDVASRYGVHLPGTYRICTITVNKLTRSPPSMLLLDDASLAFVGKGRLARHIDIVGLPTFAHVGRINRKSNRRSDEWMNRLRQTVQNFTCRDLWVYGGINFFRAYDANIPLSVNSLTLNRGNRMDY